MAAKPAKPKPYPKSLGACADLLYDVRQKRLDLDKIAAAAKEEETRLVDHIIATLPKGDEGAVGARYRVTRNNKNIPQIENFEEFTKYVSKTKSWDMLQRRLSDTAVMARIDAGKTVPGIKMFTAVKLSLTKK